MNTDELCFVAAVCSSPADDLSRLVYADWLDERADGYDPRGEFIRAQVELARLESSPFDAGSECFGCGGHVGALSTSGPHYCPACACHDALTDRRHPHYGKAETSRWRVLRRWERELFHQIDFPFLGHDQLVHGLRITKAELDECALPVKGLLVRGFVAELTLPWAAWAGGPAGSCPWCADDRRHAERYERERQVVAAAERQGAALRCSHCSGSGRTPGVAESLYWRLPPCPECLGAGDRPMADGWGVRPCPRCSGSGRVPPVIPCPKTAQPVEKVRLTTWPDEEEFSVLLEGARPNWNGTVVEDKETILSLCRQRWPSVGFEMPGNRLSFSVLHRHQLGGTDGQREV